mgnify:FL=1
MFGKIPGYSYPPTIISQFYHNRCSVFYGTLLFREAPIAHNAEDTAISGIGIAPMETVSPLHGIPAPFLDTQHNFVKSPPEQRMCLPPFATYPNPLTERRQRNNSPSLGKNKKNCKQNTLSSRIVAWQHDAIDSVLAHCNLYATYWQLLLSRKSVVTMILWMMMYYIDLYAYLGAIKWL